MKKKVLVLIITSIFLTGCWDQKVFEQIGFMLNVSIESSGDEELLVTYTSPVIGEKKTPNQVELIAVKGSILRDARINARRRSAKMLEAGKIQQVLISEEIARKGGILNLIEVLLRDPVDPAQAWLVVVDGSPNELIAASTKFKDKPRPSVYLNQLLVNSAKSSYTPNTFLYEYNINYFAQGIDAITPLIKLSSQEIVVTGSALFSGDKMVGKIDHIQTAFISAMKGRPGESFFSVLYPLPEGIALEKEDMAIDLRSSKRKISINMVNNKPVINISLKFAGYIEEYVWDKLSDASVQQELEKYLEKKIEKDCIRTLEYVRRTGSDPIGIGDMIRAKYRNYWKSVDWNEAYKDCKMTVDVKLDIKQFGAID